jgi:hypothetical protein
MDKRVVYPAAIPQSLDILYSNLYAEIAVTKLAQALLGGGPAIRGLACGANTPAALTVVVGPGEVYTMASLLPAAYSSIALDTAHQVLKQGVSLDNVVLSCPAPGTAGQSINYLVQVAMSESDADLAVLQYYNAANPTQPYSGAGGNGVSQAQTRKCGVAVQVKAGTAATTGSQVTPTPDAGYIGLWVVTVANGQTTITSGNISLYPGAPLVTSSMAARPGYGAWLSSDQSIATATWTKLLLATKDFDTHLCYSTTNARFTPTAPGFYAIQATADLKVAVNQCGFQLSAYVNGALARSGPTSRASGTGHVGASLSTTLYLNGTTDYLEIWGYQDSGSSQSIDSVQARTHVQVMRTA